ncbi:MAG: PLDc N-terminal domain-containing protein [Solirubrobacteraceae bacterium]
MILASSYPFLEVLWTLFIFVGLVIWLYLLFVVFADIFRRRDESGWTKVLWIIFIVVLPFFGVFVYLIVENSGMAERSLSRQ